MKASKALELINDAYVPGVVAFFDAQTPNPWQRAHDDLDRAMFLNDAQILSAVLESFTSRCLAMIDLFKKSGIKAVNLTSQDAFHMADPKKVSNWNSNKQRVCINCESPDGLKIVEASPGSLGVVLKCKQCLSGNAA